MNKNLERRLDEIKDRCQLFSVLKDTELIVKKTDLMEYECSNILQKLVSLLKPSFVGLITSVEFSTYIVKVFAAAPFELSVNSLTQGLRQCNREKGKYIVRILKEIENDGFKNILIESLTKSCFYNFSKFAQLVYHMPDLIHNALGTDTSICEAANRSLISDFLKSHTMCVFSGLKNALEIGEKLFKNEKDVNLSLIALLLPTLSKLDMKVFQSLVDWILEHPIDPIWERFCVRIFTYTSRDAFQTERFMQCIVSIVKDGIDLKRLFGDGIIRENFVKEIFFSKMLLVKYYEIDKNIPLKLAHSLHIGNLKENYLGPWSSVHIDAIKSLSYLWADESHLKYVTDEQRSYLEIALLSFVKCANSRIREEVSAEVGKLLALGVQMYLKNHQVVRRYRGLLVAETLTKWLSLGDLHFDYPSEVEKDLMHINDLISKDVDDLLRVDISVKPLQTNNDNNEKIFSKKLCKNNKLNEEGRKSNGKVEEIDSDDDLPPSDKEKATSSLEMTSEDYILMENQVDSPNYMHDCLEMLNEKENFGRFEAAFNVLNQLIRHRVVGYNQLAEELIRLLVNLPDRFGTANFQERRLEMLTSCLVQSPHLVSSIIDIMFSKSCCVFDRYVILDSICAAAKELSSPDSFKSNKKSANDVLKTDGKLKEWQLIINERISAKTRFRTQAVKKALVKNHFADYAGAFFYPLTSFEKKREHLNLLNNDFMLLSKIYFVLGHLIQCAQNCPSTPNMAKSLAGYLFSLRNHEDSSVRQSVLFCYSSICLSLSDEVLIALFSDCLTDWLNYASRLVQDDSSSDCREMAVVTMKCILNIIKNSE